MRRTILKVIVFIGSFLIFGAVIQGALKAFPAARPTIPIMGMYGGVIERVDLAGKDFSVKNGTEEMTFYLSDHAKITEGKKMLAFGDLKKGQEVTIEYMKEGDELVADVISVNVLKQVDEGQAVPRK